MGFGNAAFFLDDFLCFGKLGGEGASCDHYSSFLAVGKINVLEFPDRRRES